MVVARKYPKYTPEFREQAARMVVEGQRPIAEVTREYGLGETTHRQLGQEVSG